MKILFFLLLFLSSIFANILQNAIDNAKPYSIIKLPNGTYEGNIKINKPLTILGKGDNVIIDGQNIKNVIEIISSDVTLKNLIIKGSGTRIDRDDSAIKISNAKNILIDSCIIKEFLHAINAEMMENSTIKDNKIFSSEENIAQRGDALKFYYAKNNLILNNEISSVKDVKFSYSNNNIFKQNSVKESRYGLHLLMSHDNVIEENIFLANLTGLLVTGAKNTKVIKNSIKSSKGAASIAVLLKGVSNFSFSENIVSFNAKAFYIDAKHNEEEIKRFITNNTISYNIEAFHFHGALKYNLIKNNTIIGNIDDVVKSTRGNFSSKNIVEQNYWDHYSGFDSNNDNIGDTTYKMYSYADRLWHYNNKVKFFYASPIMSLLNFIFNLAPFVEPDLLLEDTKPIVELSNKDD